MADRGYWLPYTEGQLTGTFIEDNTTIDGTQIAEINAQFNTNAVVVFTYLDVEYVAKVVTSTFSLKLYSIVTTVYKAEDGTLKWTRTDYVEKITASKGLGGYDTLISPSLFVIGNKLCIPVYNTYYYPNQSTNPGATYAAFEIVMHSISFDGVDFSSSTIALVDAVYKDIGSGSNKWQACHLLGSDYYTITSVSTPFSPYMSTYVRSSPRRQDAIYMQWNMPGYKYLGVGSISSIKPNHLIFKITATTGTKIPLGGNNAADNVSEYYTSTGSYIVSSDKIITYGYKTSVVGPTTTYYEKGLLLYDSTSGALLSYDDTYWNNTVVLRYNYNTTTSVEYIIASVSAGANYLFTNGAYTSTLAVNNNGTDNMNLINYSSVNLFIYTDTNGYVRSVDLASDATPYNWVMDTGTQTEFKRSKGALGDMYLIEREATILGVDKKYISGVTFQGNNLFNIDCTGATVTYPFFGRWYLYVPNATKTMVIWKQEHTGNFWVESTDPLDNAINVPINYPIEIEFNLAPDIDTINETDLTIKIGDLQYPYALYYPGSGVTIYLKTYDDLQPSAHVDVALTADIKSEADAYDLEAYSFDFNTADDGPSTEDPPDAPGVPITSAGFTSPIGPEQGSNKYRRIQRSSYGELDEGQFIT